MEIRISVEEFDNIDYDEFDEAIPLHIDYEAGDTIIITGDGELLDDFRGGRVMLTFEKCKKPYHLVLENGQKKMPHNFAENNAMGNLISFSAPDLLELGEFNLAYCPELKSVNLPSLKIICRGAFYSCKSLTEIDLPNVEEIDDEAFYMCESLEKINAPKVEFIGYNVFNECVSLQKAILPKISETNGIFQDSVNLREINLSSLKEVDSSEFFSFDKLREIDISSAETIGAEAFQNCTDLRYIKAPNVAEIGENAFQGCEHIEFIDFPRVEIIGDWAFESCKSLKSVNLPNVKQVGESAFCGCESLKKVVMPSLRKISSMGFYLCPIELIDIPEYVEAEYDSFSLLATKNNPVIKNIQDRSIKKSFNGLLEDAAKGDAEAQFLLGWAYADGKYELDLEGSFIGFDIEKNMDLAIEYWKKAAAQKFSRAMYKLANEYLSGENIERNEAEAIKLLISSAESGFWKAQLELAGYYSEGKYLDQNIDEARKWYRIVLKDGDPEALERLIALHNEYPEPEQNMPEDETEAIYFKAEHGDRSAICTIANLHKWNQLHRLKQEEKFLQLMI